MSKYMTEKWLGCKKNSKRSATEWETDGVKGKAEPKRYSTCAELNTLQINIDLEYVKKERYMSNKLYNCKEGSNILSNC